MIKLVGGGAEVATSSAELRVLNNAMNEVCNGLYIDGYENSLGVTRETAVELLARVNSAAQAGPRRGIESSVGAGRLHLTPLKHLLTPRYTSGPLVLTSNRGFDTWSEILGEKGLRTGMPKRSHLTTSTGFRSQTHTAPNVRFDGGAPARPCRTGPPTLPRRRLRPAGQTLAAGAIARAKSWELLGKRQPPGSGRE
jgi:hypothetical protein